MEQYLWWKINPSAFEEPLFGTLRHEAESSHQLYLKRSSSLYQKEGKKKKPERNKECFEFLPSDKTKIHFRHPKCVMLLCRTDSVIENKKSERNVFQSPPICCVISWKWTTEKPGFQLNWRFWNKGTIPFYFSLSYLKVNWYIFFYLNTFTFEPCT